MGSIKYNLHGYHYTYSNDDLDLFEQYPPEIGQWDNHRYDNFKRNLKTQYYRFQKERCAFCRRDLNLFGQHDTIEHIVSKDDYPNWMFESKNLVLACRPCNTSKGKYNTLVNPYNSNIYPNSGLSFVSLNPHFENWHSHIKLKMGLFFVAKTIVGYKTIKAYKLYRPDILDFHSKRKQIKRGDLTKKMTKLLYSLDPASDNFKEIKNSINIIVGID